MRNAFAKAMTELAQERDDLCLLSGDIGNRMFDHFKEIAPKRFMNCGIAEANMMSMAAGMGLCGLRPVVYTITPFTTTRCLEQIRTGAAYHKAPVVIVGTGSGLSYAELGATHHSLEDIAITRCIPCLTVCAPCDAIELKSQLRDALNQEAPTYIRIGKKGEPDLVNREGNIKIGKASTIAIGEEIVVLGIGPILSEALKARDVLKKKGINLGVSSMGTVKPLDTDYLVDIIAKGYTKWISLEEHQIIGGLGSALLEWINEEKIKGVELKRIGAPDKFIHKLGPQDYVRQIIGLNSEKVVMTAESF